jgi:hypothetical protein
VFGELLALLVMVTFPVTLPVVLGANTTPSSAVCPAAIVAPATPLFTANPVPLTETPEIVMLDVPVFLTATPSVLVPPTVSLPKFRLEVDSESVFVDVVPVPLVHMARDGFDALLFNVTFPVTLPVAVGAYAMVKLFVAEAARVSGIVSPLILKPTPLTVALEIVKLEPPVFFSSTVCEFVVPVATFPKAMLDGVAVSVAAPAVPVPLNEYCTLLLVALLV